MEEVKLDRETNLREGKLTRERFDIRKAIIIGIAGDLDYAQELLSDLGRIAQDTGNIPLEDEVDDALTSLGL